MQEFDNDFPEKKAPFGDLSSIFNALKRHKRFLITAFILLFIFFTGSAFIFHTFQTKQFVTSCEFELIFKNLNRSKYPGGLPFHQSDILSLPVLTQVYNNNPSLRSKMDFNEFKDSLSIIQTNDRIALLEMEFSNRFQDRRLGLGDIISLENIFKTRKGLLGRPVFQMRIINESIFPLFTDIEYNKILGDILKEYSIYATRMKGANQYRVSIMSPSVLEFVSADEYEKVAKLDKIYLTIDDLISDIIFVRAMPGASLVETADGLTINDILQYTKFLKYNELLPLLQIAVFEVAEEERSINMNYLSSRINNIKINKDLTQNKFDNYRDSLMTYMESSAFGNNAPQLLQSFSETGGHSGDQPYIIPQLSASFIDSLMDIVKQDSGSHYIQSSIEQMILTGGELQRQRQNLKKYEQLLERFNSEKSRNIPLAGIDAGHSYLSPDQITERMINIIKDVNTIFDKLSIYNARSESTLYSFTKPPSTNITPRFRLALLLLVAFLAISFLMSMIIFVVLLMNN